MVCGGPFVVVDCANMAGADRTKSAAPLRIVFIAFITSSPSMSAYLFLAFYRFTTKAVMPMKHRPARIVVLGKRSVIRLVDAVACKGTKRFHLARSCIQFCGGCVLTMAACRMRSGTFEC